MDEDIRERLKELSEHIQAVARQIGSTKIDIQGLMAMRDTLRMNADTVDTYVGILKMRIEE